MECAFRTRNSIFTPTAGEHLWIRLVRRAKFRYHPDMAKRTCGPVRIQFRAAARPELLAGVSTVLYGEFSEKCQLLVDGAVAEQPMGFYDAAIVRVRDGDEIDYWRSFAGPTVVINNAMTEVPLPQVLADDHAIGRMAADYFLRRGFRRFVYAGDNSGFSLLRARAFLQALGEAEITGVPCPRGNSTVSIVPISQMLSQHPSEPIAVFCCNDWRANALINQATENGIKCPRNIAVMGVDDDHIPNSCCHVSISSIKPPYYEIGRQAAQLLVRLLRGEAPPADPILLPPLGIVTRQSTDRYATDNPALERAVRFMEANVDRNISVEDIAKAAGHKVALRTLQRHFRQTFGETMVDALLRSRISRAKNLLASGDLSIKEIAYLTGFASSSHLCLTFRRFEATTPGAFRKRILSAPR
jgi:LacI family transcriptional regulator